ncbi:MAG: NUDIX domain-containing protein [Candidatus Aenigmatarchaeota archaeon]
MVSYKNPKPTVDVLVESNGKIILVKRGNGPFKGKLALPGGFVEFGETVENAAKREMKEETNLQVRLKDLLGVYSDPDRDPRGHTISTVFVAEIESGEIKGGSDAEEAMWLDLDVIEEEDMAFDHFKIIQEYINS